MQFKNSYTRYGMVSKLLHWTITLLVLGQVYLAYWTIYVLPENSETAKLFIGGLHIPNGVVILLLTLFAIYWRLTNIRPAFPSTMPQWEKTSANIVHFLLYVGLLIMPLSGFIMVNAGGHPPNFYGLYQFPVIMEKNVELAKTAYAVHQFAGYAVIALVVIHTLAAIKHHFFDHDMVLKRMLP